MTKVCKKCSKDLNVSLFYQETVKATGKILIAANCRKCSNEIRQEWRKNNPNKVLVQLERSRAERAKVRKDPVKNAILNKKKRESYKTPTGVVKRLWVAAKQRAERNGLDFDIELSDIVVPVMCPYLGYPLVPGNANNYYNSPSLDRIDNTKGYVKGNIQVISTRANTAKSCLTLEELKLFATNILSKI